MMATKHKNSNGKTSERHIGVLLEHLDDKISTVAEQYGDIKSEIGGIKKTLDVHTEMIGKLATDVEVLKEDVGVLKEDVKVLKEDMTEVKGDISIIKEDIEFIKGDLKKKVDIEEFMALERRVAMLEKHRQ